MFRKSVMERVRLIALAVLVLALVTVACAPQPTATLSPTATPLPAKTTTATPTQTPTPRPTDTPMPTPTPVPSLSGRVTDAATGQGIEGAMIEVSQSGVTGWDYCAATGPDGRYALYELPVGDYRVRTTAPGYAREYWDNVTSSSEASLVTVSASVTTKDIDFVLTEGGSISGHVYQSDGITPIVGAEVRVCPSKYQEDDGFWATTDDEGAYKIEGLSLGSFKVEARVPGYNNYFRYYSEVENGYGWWQSADVTVVPPANTPNIDIHLHIGASISGHVYQSDGITPLAHVHVNAEIAYGIGGYDTDSDSDGYYILEGLPSGNFVVNVVLPGFAHRWYDSKPDKISADLITLAEGEALTGIDFALDIGAPVRGHVYNEAGESMSGIHVSADVGGHGVDNSYTDSSGAYELWLGTGDYYIRYDPDNNPNFVPEWYNDTYRAEDADLVHVEAPHEVTGIDFYLARAGSISGHVYEADETTPIPSASVYAFPTTGSHPGAGANTGPDGSYTIVGLPSGYYRVQAIVSGHESQFYHSAADEASATAVTVNAPSDTPAIDFALSPASE